MNYNQESGKYKDEDYLDKLLPPPHLGGEHVMEHEHLVLIKSTVL